MKRAGAYKRKKKIYLDPMSKTTNGLWIGTSPLIIFDETEPPSIKGKYVRETLRHSKEGVPDPTDWDSFHRTFLKEVGARSWNTFAKTALSCTINLEGDQLVFHPYRNSGPNENYAFVPIRDRKMTLSFDASDEEVGLFLERAFETCEQQKKAGSGRLLTSLEYVTQPVHVEAIAHSISGNPMACFFGLEHYGSAGSVVCRLKQRIANDRSLRVKVETVQRHMSQEKT